MIEVIRISIREIKSGEATEPDNLTIDALKSDIEITMTMLHILFRNIWEGEQMSLTDWEHK